MQRRHFEAIAEVLCVLKHDLSKADHRRVVNEFADMLVRQNTRFDRGRFEIACGKENTRSSLHVRVDRKMIMFKLEDQLLGEFVDRNSLQSVIETLARHCGDKAVQAAVSWQNVPLAKKWERAAAFLEQAANNEFVVDAS